MDRNRLAVSRVKRSKQEAKATYDRLSRWYDLLAGTSEAKFRETGRHMLDVQPGESVLEIGFGTGHEVVAMAHAAGPSGHVCGLDLSVGMIDVTRGRVAKADLSDHVGLTRGDAGSLPFSTGCFDAIFMSFVLELMDTPEIPVVVQECRRVLTQDGRMAVVALAMKSEPNLALRLYEWAHHTFPTYADCRPIFVQQAVETGGFDIIEVREKSMWGLPVKIVMARQGQKQ